MVDKFINSSDKSIQSIVKKIIDNTLHISFEYFLLGLYNIFKKFLKNIKENKLYIKDKKGKCRPIFIFIDNKSTNYKEKSNYWLFTLFKTYFKDLKIVTINSFTDSKLLSNDIIVFIDDCVYTGTQLSNTISFNTMIFTSNELKFNIFILIPFITREGKYTINNTIKYNTVLSKCNLHILYFKQFDINTSNILSSTEISKIQYFYGTHEDFENKYLIYFDHKLADTSSTIPLFYSGLVPCLSNKTILDNDFITSSNESKLLFIPFINHCQNIRNLNTIIPECPYPIYKEEAFKRFILNINKSKTFTRLSI